MMYTRGPKIKHEYDLNNVKHAARVAAELGADIVKVVYTGNPESFAEVVEGCHLPVVIAGGKKIPELDALKMAYNAVQQGAAGVDMGRNIFQSEDPEAMIQAVRKVVDENLKPEEAYDFYEAKKGKTA